MEVVCVSFDFCRDLSVDAGLPPHQFHIHPLPQHYQHYLTSPRMHHFPRNNASTQVVRPILASAQSFVRGMTLLWIRRLIPTVGCSLFL